MAKIITEVLESADLFAGGADDSFEIEPGGMPNGDACLLVRGDLTQDYRAYADLSGIFTPDITDETPWSGTIICWLKLGALGGSLGTASTADTIMSVQASTAPLQNVFAENTSTSYTSWKMAAGGTDGLDVVFGTGWKSGGTKRWESCSQTLTADTWHQVAISYKQGMGMSLDGGAYANNSWGSRTTASSGSSATEFAIGSRSTESGVGGRAGQWRIGKISFHTGELTTSQLTDLYNEMMG